MKNSVLLFALFLLSSSFCLFSYGQSTTVYEELKRNENYTSLVGEIDKWPGLVTLLNDSNENTTIFAPTDAALNRTILPTGQALLDLLTYHTIPGSVLSNQLVSGSLVDTRLIVASLNNESQVVKIFINGTDYYVNDQYISISNDVVATNGVIHRIEGVLFPPGNVSSIVKADNLTLFEYLLSSVGLTFQDNNTITAVTPTDKAFNDLPDPLTTYLTSNTTEARADLINILTYHFAPSVNYAANLTGQKAVQSYLAGEVWNFEKTTVNGTMVFLINNNTAAEEDVLASNGVVQELNGVLIPTSFRFDLPKLLLGLDLSSLIGALNAANLTAVLEGPGPFTVFAPTNEAFSKITPPTGQALVDLLKYHVTSGSVLSSELYDGELISTELLLPSLDNNPQVSKVGINGNNIYINSAHVTIPNQKAMNGIVHVIDQVLSLPNDIPTVAADNGFSTLVNAAKAANLVTDLQGDSLTVFAPTNDAFGALPPGYLNYLLMPNNTASQSALSQVLLYHVVKGVVYSANVPRGVNKIPTLNGEDISVNNTATDNSTGQIIINGNAEVTKRDVLASNGVIHVINQVLLPGNVSFDIPKVLEGLNLTTFMAAAILTNTTGYYSDPANPVTVFVPNNDAFANVEDLQSLFSNREKLTEVMKNHIVNGEIPKIVNGETYKTVNGEEIEGTSGSSIKFLGDPETEANIITVTYGSNGRIYVIDRVLGTEESGSSDNKLKAWEIVLIVIGGVVAFILLLAVIAGVVWFVQHQRRNDYSEI